VVEKSMTFVFLGLRTRLLEVDQVERWSRLDWMLFSHEFISAGLQWE
jgi:hypothetical protein